MRKLLKWAALAFVVFYLVSNPAGAAHAARGAMHDLHSAAASVSTFVSSL